MKTKLSIIGLALLMLACNKKEEEKVFTVNYSAYSKNVPYCVKWHDEDMNWTKDSVYTKAYSKSIKTSKKNIDFILWAYNGKKVTGDSIHVTIEIEGQAKSDVFKTSSPLSISLSVQLSTPN